jgi:hypothetical protein
LAVFIRQHVSEVQTIRSKKEFIDFYLRVPRSRGNNFDRDIIEPPIVSVLEKQGELLVLHLENYIAALLGTVKTVGLFLLNIDYIINEYPSIDCLIKKDSVSLMQTLLFQLKLAITSIKGCENIEQFLVGISIINLPKIINEISF